jgi:hypothetical protein
MRNERFNRCAPMPPLCPFCAQNMRLARITSRFGDLPSFIPLNAELAAYRTSRQRERDHPHHGGRNSDHCQRCLAWLWPLVLMAEPVQDHFAKLTL